MIHCCKYCDTLMMGQDNDRMWNNQYCRIYVCTNDKCKAVYEEWTNGRGVSIPGKDRWFNPRTKEFEN
ncbi:hypothetical protein PAV_15c00890 [Paenibacillus alvei DSM 29]|nr:hypothetical protein PAV_15c00890 [Paenibacillus alvei DSM 29]